MPEYAAKTTVSVEQSRAEIERTLARYGAESFAYGWDRSRAVVEFSAHDRRVRFVLPLPDRAAPDFTHHSRGQRSPAEAEKRWEQACRQRWRALNLVVKAKLEAVDAGISEFEDEFLANIVLPDNTTVSQWARPAIDRAYELGSPPSPLQLGP